MPLVEVPRGICTVTSSPGDPGGSSWRLYHHITAPAMRPITATMAMSTNTHRGSLAGASSS